MGPRFEKIASSTMSTGSTNNEGRLCQLEQLFLTKMPESVNMLNICRLVRKGKIPKSELVEFYGYLESEDDPGHEDNWSTGKNAFIVCIERENIHCKKGIIVFTPTTIPPKMAKAFASFLDWEEPQLFLNIPEQFCPFVREQCYLHGRIDLVLEGVFYAILDLDKAKTLEVPQRPNVTLRQLEEKDLPEVVGSETYWTWAQEHSEREIGESFKTLTSCEAFSEKGEVLSFLFLTALGVFNAFFTPEQFRGRGYGELVIRGVSKQAAVELEIIPLAEIERTNAASRRSFQKAGYEEFFKHEWIYFNPSTKVRREAREL